MLSPTIITLLLLLQLVGHGTQALVSISTTNAKIRVAPLQSPKDLIDLGDLRYSEWMTDLPEEERPSQMAFRMATADTQQERTAQDAVAFLARDSEQALVGTAELSGIELRGCYDEAALICRYLYVTDVVTARTHRRQGIAATLMNALEEHAQAGAKSQPTVFLLHVEHDNKAALGFYQALGYKIVEGALEGLDSDRLSQNAGVSGQLLLSKRLKQTAETTKKNKAKKKAKRGGSGKGFGR